MQGIRRAFDLQIGLDTVVNNDKSKLSFNWHVSRGWWCRQT